MTNTLMNPRTTAVLDRLFQAAEDDESRHVAVDLSDAWGAADFLNSAGCRVAVVDGSVIASFRQRTEDIGLGVRDQGRVQGFNLRKMREVDVHLFTADPSAARSQ